MNKKKKFDALCNGKRQVGETLFYLILMHFASCFNGNNYGEFASNYKVLVDSNLISVCKQVKILPQASACGKVRNPKGLAEIL